MPISPPTAEHAHAALRPHTTNALRFLASRDAGCGGPTHLVRECAQPPPGSPLSTTRAGAGVSLSRQWSRSRARNGLPARSQAVPHQKYAFLTTRLPDLNLRCPSVILLIGRKSGKAAGSRPLKLAQPCDASHYLFAPPLGPQSTRQCHGSGGVLKTAAGGVASAPGRPRRRKRPFKPSPSRPHALARRGRTHRAPAARPKHCASRQVKPLRSDHAAAAHLPEITSRTSPPERQRSATHGGAPRLRCLGRRKVP